MELPLSKISTTNVAHIEFLGYDELFEKVKQLADAMKTVEVTEETIRENKKLLASVRKEAKRLDDERKQVKKEVLKPYNEIELQVKELLTMLKESEDVINSQIKEFDEKERAERISELKDLFSRYHQSYNAPSWLSWDKFIDGNMGLVTNKATSNKKKRESIINYFETFKRDYAMLKEQITDKSERSAVLMSYSKNGFRMVQAIEDYHEMISEKKRLEQDQKKVSETKVPEIVILVDGKAPEVVKEKPVDYITIRVTRDTLSRMDKLDLDYEEL